MAGLCRVRSSWLQDPSLSWTWVGGQGREVSRVYETRVSVRLLAGCGPLFVTQGLHATPATRLPLTHGACGTAGSCALPQRGSVHDDVTNKELIQWPLPHIGTLLCTPGSRAMSDCGRACAAVSCPVQMSGVVRCQQVLLIQWGMPKLRFCKPGLWS